MPGKPTLTSRGTGFPDFVRRTGVGTVESTKLVGTLGIAGGVLLLTPTPNVRDRVPLGPGSSWSGSWMAVSNFRIKTIGVQQLDVRSAPGSGAGSLFLITGFRGTGIDGMTGTYNLSRSPLGSFSTFSFTEAVAYMRTEFVQSGYARGSVSVMLNEQV